METNITWVCEKTYIPVYYGRVNGVVVFSVHPVIRLTANVNVESFVVKTSLPGLPIETSCCSPYDAILTAELLWLNWIDKMGLMLK